MRRPWILTCAILVCVGFGGLAPAWARRGSDEPAQKGQAQDSQAKKGSEGAEPPGDASSAKPDEELPPAIAAPESLIETPPVNEAPPPPPEPADEASGAKPAKKRVEELETLEAVPGSSRYRKPGLIDRSVERAQAQQKDSGPLPPAADRLGAGGATIAQDPGGDGYSLAAEKLPEGRQEVAVSVEVLAPAVVNVMQTCTLKVVVKNRGAGDALGVVVRDELPDGLAFVDSQPATAANGQLLLWRIGTLPAGTEKVILVRVKPTRIGEFNHAATVTMVSGGRSRTLVQEPKLKVEQSVSPARVLKGRQVTFNVAVSNPGTGPARNVTVLARLSPGLKHDQGEELKQVIPVIKPGERIKLDLLTVDAVADGEQYCEVSAASPDVVEVAPEAKRLDSVIVVAPKLAIAIEGPKTRYTGTPASYRITVSNPGSAPAKGIRVTAQLPASSGKVTPRNEAQYDRYKHTLFWTTPQLEPGQSIDYSFEVLLGGVQLYQVAVEARGDHALVEKRTFETDVTGIADVDFQVKERLRVVDAGETVTYEINIRNTGSREATNLLVNARLSKNLSNPETTGTEQSAQFNAQTNVVKFPVIPRLAARDGEITLSIKVKAAEAGVATCKVGLMHDDLGDSELAKTAATRVMPRPPGNIR